MILKLLLHFINVRAWFQFRCAKEVFWELLPALRIDYVGSWKTISPVAFARFFSQRVCCMFWWLVTAQLLMHIHAKRQPKQTNRRDCCGAACKSTRPQSSARKDVIEDFLATASVCHLHSAVLPLRQLLPSIFVVGIHEYAKGHSVSRDSNSTNSLDETKGCGLLLHKRQSMARSWRWVAQRALRIS